MVTDLTCRTRERATDEWAKYSSSCDSVVAFSAALTCVFGQLSTGLEAARALGSLRQGRSRFFDHAIRFRTLTAESRWNNEALGDMFYLSLSENIKNCLGHRLFGPWWNLLLGSTTDCRTASGSVELQNMRIVIAEGCLALLRPLWSAPHLDPNCLTQR